MSVIGTTADSPQLDGKRLFLTHNGPSYDCWDHYFSLTSKLLTIAIPAPGGRLLQGKSAVFLTHAIAFGLPS